MKKFFNLFNDGKFVVAIVTIVTGILGLFNLSDNMIGCIGSILAIVLPSVGYLVVSGIVDWQKISNAITEILKIIEDYRKNENNTEDTDTEGTDTEEVRSGAVAESKADYTLRQIEDILRSLI